MNSFMSLSLVERRAVLVERREKRKLAEQKLAEQKPLSDIVIPTSSVTVVVAEIASKAPKANIRRQQIIEEFRLTKEARAAKAVAAKVVKKVVASAKREEIVCPEEIRVTSVPQHRQASPLKGCLKKVQANPYGTVECGIAYVDMNDDEILEWEGYTQELNETVVTLDSINQERRALGLPAIRAMRDRLNWRTRSYSKLRMQEYLNTIREIPFFFDQVMYGEVDEEEHAEVVRAETEQAVNVEQQDRREAEVKELQARMPLASALCPGAPRKMIRTLHGAVRAWNEEEEESSEDDDEEDAELAAQPRLLAFVLE